MKMLGLTVLIAMTGIISEARAQGDMRACLYGLSALYDRQADESNTIESELSAIDDNDYAKLCAYGQSRGLPTMRRFVAEQRTQKGVICWNSTAERTLRDTERKLNTLVRAVASDCAKAKRSR